MAEIKKGAWSPEEDQKLKDYIMRYDIWNWRQMPKFAGLSRTGKSCRLRWVNYLRPDIKRGPFSMEEVEIVMKMYQECGNRWSTIAANLPGRTDNEVKNFFHTHLKKHLGVKDDASVKTKGRSKSKRVKKTSENEEKNASNAQERSADVASPCSSIVTCEENQMMDVMDFSKTYQDCYNVSSVVDQPVINVENTAILESFPETSENIDIANCQLHQFVYSHPCSSLIDGYNFNSLDQFDMNSFWSDVIADSEHLIF